MVSFTVGSLQLPGKVPRYPQTSRLGKSQSPSRHFGADKDLLTVSGNVWSVALSLMLTTLLRLEEEEEEEEKEKKKKRTRMSRL